MLLQIADEQGNLPPETFLRCRMSVENGEAHGVVFLEGQYAGTFTSDHEINLRPALDISELAQIVVENPAPRTGGGRHKIAAGNVCQATNRYGNSFLYIAVSLVGAQSSVLGYAFLNGPHRGHITLVDQPIYVGTASVIPLKLPESPHN